MGSREGERDFPLNFDIKPSIFEMSIAYGIKLQFLALGIEASKIRPIQKTSNKKLLMFNSN